MPKKNVFASSQPIVVQEEQLKKEHMIEIQDSSWTESGIADCRCPGNWTCGQGTHLWQTATKVQNFSFELVIKTELWHFCESARHTFGMATAETIAHWKRSVDKISDVSWMMRGSWDLVESLL